ncbi:MAG TPA: VOC family protein [Polyangia bacterium]|jgi:predicted enzyme related to lactoylglutathione lyase|nr:VOC family protein [Polyangia bacterium]
MATVGETFFVVEVQDMRRATAFYGAALGATVVFASELWTSLSVAGVRVALSVNGAALAGRTGLHFVVDDVAAARADVVRAGGAASAAAVEVAPGVVIADVVDSEGNGFTLSQRAARAGAAR